MMARFTTVPAFICLPRSAKEHRHSSRAFFRLHGFVRSTGVDQPRSEQKHTELFHDFSMENTTAFRRRLHSLDNFAFAPGIRHASPTHNREIRAQARRFFRFVLHSSALYFCRGRSMIRSCSLVISLIGNRATAR
jgi:hypothetical protein